MTRYYMIGAHGSYPVYPETIESVVETGRLVVVIDPEDREAVGSLLSTYWGSTCTTHPNGNECGSHSCGTDALQAALRSLVADPKPVEPQGLGAVVEDAEGRRWVRVGHDGRSWCTAPGTWAAWTNVAAVRVLAEGWSA